MTLFKKILGAAVVATLAMSVVATSASAHNPQNYKGTGILPVAAGPFGAAALFPATNTIHWTTTKLYSKTYFKGFKWVKVNYKWVKVPDYKTKTYTKTKHHSKSSKTVGKAVVGCIFGSALGAITASVRKASAMGNPPRWRSQAEHEKIVASGYEKQFELTNDEAHTAVSLCGLGSFALHWQQKAPAPVVVKARY
jgi:hypothetical protein